MKSQQLVQAAVTVFFLFACPETGSPSESPVEVKTTAPVTPPAAPRKARWPWPLLQSILASDLYSHSWKACSGFPEMHSCSAKPHAEVNSISVMLWYLCQQTGTLGGEVPVKCTPHWKGLVPSSATLWHHSYIAMAIVLGCQFYRTFYFTFLHVSLLHIGYTF